MFARFVALALRRVACAAYARLIGWTGQRIGRLVSGGGAMRFALAMTGVAGKALLLVGVRLEVRRRFAVAGSAYLAQVLRVSGKYERGGE